MSADIKGLGVSLLIYGVADPTRRANQVIDFSSVTARTCPNGATESLRQKTDFPMRFNLMNDFKFRLENNSLPFFGKS